MLGALNLFIGKVHAAPLVDDKTKYKLTYFNVRAKAEVIRWIFAVAGVEYEDKRIDNAEWAKMKDTVPFGQLPILEENGTVWCQSWTIARMLSKRFGLMGKSEYEENRINMIVDCVDDMTRPAIRLNFASDEDRPKLEKEWKEVEEPRYCSRFEKLLISNNGGDGYFVGDSLSLADISVCVWMGWVRPVDYTPYPKLAGHRARVISQHRIAAWLAKRPETKF